MDSARAAGQQAPEIPAPHSSPSLPPKYWNYRDLPPCWSPNAGPCVYTASTLPAEPFPWLCGCQSCQLNKCRH